MHIALLIPTYNEAKNIGRLLTEIAQQCRQESKIDLDVFVIDDNSPDQTADVVKGLEPTLRAENFHIQVLHRPKKEGLGAAYIQGFSHVLGLNRYQYVLQMDADLSHQPQYLQQFFRAALEGKQLVIASRYIEGGAIANWGWHRLFLSKFGNLYARLLLGSQVSDFTGGFNMYSVGVLRSIAFDQLAVAGYGFLIKLKFLAAKSARQIAHDSIENFPIVFVDRTAGESKMPLNTLVTNFMLVLNLWRKK